MTIGWRVCRAGLAAVGLLAAALGCGACARSAPDAEAAATEAAPERFPGPCDLLTVAEIEAELGSPIQAGQRDDDRCNYGRLLNAAGYSAPVLTLRLEHAAAAPLTLLAIYQSTLRSTLGQYDPVAIDGLGDAAAWDGTSLVVVRATGADESAFLSVQLHDLGVAIDTEREIARALAALALARLNAK